MFPFLSFSLCAISFLILLIFASRTCGRIICINHNTIHSVEYIDSAFGSLLFTEAKNGNKCQVDLFIWYTVDNVYALGNFNVQLYKQIELYIIGYYRLYFKQCNTGHKVPSMQWFDIALLVIKILSIHGGIFKQFMSLCCDACNAKHLAPYKVSFAVVWKIKCPHWSEQS